MKGKTYTMNVIEKRIKKVASAENFLNAMKEEFGDDYTKITFAQK